jgi:hypothetical protein
LGVVPGISRRDDTARPLRPGSALIDTLISIKAPRHFRVWRILLILVGPFGRLVRLEWASGILVSAIYPA